MQLHVQIVEFYPFSVIENQTWVTLFAHNWYFHQLLSLTFMLIQVKPKWNH